MYLQFSRKSLGPLAYSFAVNATTCFTQKRISVTKRSCTPAAIVNTHKEQITVVSTSTVLNRKSSTICPSYSFHCFVSDNRSNSSLLIFCAPLVNWLLLFPMLYTTLLCLVLKTTYASSVANKRPCFSSRRPWKLKRTCVSTTSVLIPTVGSSGPNRLSSSCNRTRLSCVNNYFYSYSRPFIFPFGTLR